VTDKKEMGQGRGWEVGGFVDNGSGGSGSGSGSASGSGQQQQRQLILTTYVAVGRVAY
jgi:hypothetical protein